MYTIEYTNYSREFLDYTCPSAKQDWKINISTILPPSSPVSSRKTKACVRVTGRRNWLSTEFGHETV